MSAEIRGQDANHGNIMQKLVEYASYSKFYHRFPK